MFSLNKRFDISLPPMIEWMLYYIDISVDINRKVLLLFNEKSERAYDRPSEYPPVRGENLLFKEKFERV